MTVSLPTHICVTRPQWVNSLAPARCGRNFNTLRLRPNRRLFADDFFKCIFLNKDGWISIQISLKFVPKGPINIIAALGQIMAWRRVGDKPLSEPMMVRLLTHICVTRPQWVKSIIFKFIIKNSSSETQYEIGLRWMPENLTNEKSTLVQVMTWCNQVTSH